jgi:hypothetical protein
MILVIDIGREVWKRSKGICRMGRAHKRENANIFGCISEIYIFKLRMEKPFSHVFITLCPSDRPKIDPAKTDVVLFDARVCLRTGREQRARS